MIGPKIVRVDSFTAKNELLLRLRYSRYRVIIAVDRNGNVKIVKDNLGSASLADERGAAGEDR